MALVDKLCRFVMIFAVPGAGCLIYGRMTGSTSVRGIGLAFILVAICSSFIPMIGFLVSKLLGEVKRQNTPSGNSSEMDLPENKERDE